MASHDATGGSNPTIPSARDNCLGRDHRTCAEYAAELARLRAENVRLKSLLAANGIPWDGAADPVASRIQAATDEAANTADPPEPHETLPAPAATPLDPDAKVALFRRLFRGREDVYAIRWESSRGKSGYSPACANEWLPGICRKPGTRCAECDQRQLLPITDRVIYDHLVGAHTVGVYPLLPDDSCWFLAVDFDRADWRLDVAAFMQTCDSLNVPTALEVSRSGAGAHAWIFFAEAIPARLARSLGTALISHTCSRSRLLGLDSYDRLFPNQDTLPRGGFGNLIALPLQRAPRTRGHSVFVDRQLCPYTDQWAFLATVRRLSTTGVRDAIRLANAGGVGGQPLDVAFLGEEGEPWRRIPASADRIPGPMPEAVKVVLANRVFIEKAHLPQPLVNRLVRLAAFPNPEWYKAQALRFSVWNKPRVIGCAEDFPQHIGLPRGCVEAVLELLGQHNIKVETQDERCQGAPVAAIFKGQMRTDQEAAVEAMLATETGVLCAPTAFGKTVVAAALIARRQISTLVLVHRMELLKQWRERLGALLELPEGGLGVIGGGTRKASGQIDIAVMQSLSRWEGLPELLDGYGQIIADECHHVSAFTFEGILKQARARHVVGLTATPTRRDGHHPIIFMQCGPIRHTAGRQANAPTTMEVWQRILPAPELAAEASIQEVFRALATSAPRNERIAHDVVEAWREGRKVLVLTERKDHLELLREAVGAEVAAAAAMENPMAGYFVLHGRMSQRRRTAVLNELASLDPAAPRVIIATGRLIGEGFDHPPLDTLVLAMPISWRGTLQQYAGRLHRDHVGKRDIRIYDYVEQDHPQLAGMWQKRVRGYRAMEYKVKVLPCSRSSSQGGPA